METTHSFLAAVTVVSVSWIAVDIDSLETLLVSVIALRKDLKLRRFRG